MYLELQCFESKIQNGTIKKRMRTLKILVALLGYKTQWNVHWLDSLEPMVACVAMNFRALLFTHLPMKS